MLVIGSCTAKSAPFPVKHDRAPCGTEPAVLMFSTVSPRACGPGSRRHRDRMSAMSTLVTNAILGCLIVALLVVVGAVVALCADGPCAECEQAVGSPFVIRW